MADPIISVTPDTLTLNPGESAQVTVAVDAASFSGAASVVIAVEVPSQYDYEIEGDTALTIGPGETGHIIGDVNLTGDLIVEGVLTGIDTFTVEGNGFQILGQNGGVLNLAGVEKSAWVRWGEPVVGWQVGDRLTVAPTAPGVYVPTEIVWAGDWVSTARPANSPDVTLLDSRIIGPEVVNLSQTIVLKNLTRLHFHDTAGVQTLRYLRVLDSGVTALLAHYSIHFHQLGEAARGSLVEGVVVEGSKNHSFVPHASHGIVMRDCVAYNGISEPFWWDEPTSKTHTANNSNDTIWEHCLVLGPISNATSAFVHGAGSGNSAISNAVACRHTGFFWPGFANQNVGGNVWDFHDNVAHNCSPGEGVRAWQNDFNPHHPQDTVVYNCPTGLGSGAYNNAYTFSRFLIQGSPIAVKQAAVGTIKHFDHVTDGKLLIAAHNGNPSVAWLEFTRCTFTQVWYNGDQGDKLSWIRYIDCGLTPADFRLTFTQSGVEKPGINPQSKIEIVEGGVLVHSWTAGVWS